MLADGIAEHLTGDEACYSNPEKYFDRVVEINLSELEPHVNGPYTPDLAWPISQFAAAVKEKGYPAKLEVGLIGSCTNSSYEDPVSYTHLDVYKRQVYRDLKKKSIIRRPHLNIFSNVPMPQKQKLTRSEHH